MMVPASVRRWPRVRIAPFCVVFVVAIAQSCSGSEKAIDRPVKGPNALMEGFAVPRFAMTKGFDEQHLPSIEWRAPDDTTIVRCALFWCAPQFEVVEHHSASPGTSLRRIKNYSECALAHEDSRGPSGSLTLSNFNPIDLNGRIPEKIKAGMDPDFTVGCWSFSEADVNGASLLVPLFPSEAGSLVSVGVSTDCSAKKADDLFICEFGEKGAPPVTVGWCVTNGDCEPLCKACSDCIDLPPIKGYLYGDCEALDAGVSLCTGAVTPTPTCKDAG